MTASRRALLAEDEVVIATIIHELLSEQGYEVTVCNDGATAWDKLQNDADVYDVVLLDRIMPKMNGIDLLRHIKSSPKLSPLPVIMETVQDDKESIREGLAQGAYYYLTKPLDASVLVAVVDAAVSQGRELRDLIDGVRRADATLTLMQSSRFRFNHLDDAHMLAKFMARACPEPERTIQGLQELLVNAVEHGNLEITYKDKSRLLAAGAWRDEVLTRLSMPKYSDRYIDVFFERLPSHLRFTIQDQGAGFDWQEYLDFSTERAFDLHGRGIAMASKFSFDKIEYEGNGNRVVTTILLDNQSITPRTVQ